VLQATGDAQGALDAIERSRQNAAMLSPWLGNHAAAQQARMWLAQENHVAAAGWVQESGLAFEDYP